MKFCMVTTFYPPNHFGGDAVYVKQLVDALAAAGHEVHVVHCQDAYAIAGGTPRTVAPGHPAIHVHSLHGPGQWLSPLLTQQTGRLGFKRGAFARIFEDHRFDVVHFHNISLIGVLDLMEFAPRAVKLLTLHDYWLVCPTHVMFRNREAACQAPKCLRCQLLHGRPPQLWRSRKRIQRAVRNLDRVLAGSRFAIDLLRDRGLEIRGEVLPLFAPAANPDSAPANHHGRPYYLFAGRLVKLKGLQDVLPYFRSRPDVDLLIAGEGNYRDELRRIADGSENIRFLGQQSRAELGALYRDAIATLMPSLTYEISPMVIGESWAQQTPVVTRDIGALGELVTESGGGRVFSDTAQMESHLDALAADPAKRDRLGRAGHAAWARDWSPDQNLSRYLGLVETLQTEKNA